jgi:hypothetical protein
MATYKAALQLKELVDEAKAAGMDVAEEEAFYNIAKSPLTSSITPLTRRREG